MVEGLAGWVLDQALDPAARDAAPVAARCGLVRTRRVTARTTLLVARFRYHLKPRASEDLTLLCEEIVPLAFHGSPQSPEWIEGDDAEALLSCRPEANLIHLSWTSSSRCFWAACPTSKMHWESSGRSPRRLSTGGP